MAPNEHVSIQEYTGFWWGVLINYLTTRVESNGPVETTFPWKMNDEDGGASITKMQIILFHHNHDHHHYYHHHQHRHQRHHHHYCSRHHYHNLQKAFVSFFLNHTSYSVIFFLISTIWQLVVSLSNLIKYLMNKFKRMNSNRIYGAQNQLEL